MDASLTVPATKREIHLADYQPPSFNIEHTRLTVELFSDHAVVTAVSKFCRIDKSVPNLHLDGSPYMTLQEAAVNGCLLSDDGYKLSDGSLVLSAVPDSFELRLKTKLFPHENTRLEGLYHSGGNFCTQCEAEGFRHITFFLDRPDVLTTYDVRIEADKSSCPILLSNGNPGSTGELGNGRHFAEQTG